MKQPALWPGVGVFLVSSAAGLVVLGLLRSTSDISPGFWTSAGVAIALVSAISTLGTVLLSTRSRPSIDHADQPLVQGIPGHDGFKLLVETMSDGLAVQNADREFTYVNDRLCEITGYSREELVGAPVDRILDEAARAEMRRQMDARRTGANASYELQTARKDGSPIYIAISAVPLFDRQGKFVGSFGTVRDLTQRKRAEDELRVTKGKLESLVKVQSRTLVERETQFEGVVKNVPGIVFRRIRYPDGHDGMPYVGGRAKEILGITAEDLMKNPGLARNILDPDDLALWQETQKISAENLEAYDIEARVQSADGGTKWIRSLAHPCRGKNGEIIWDGIVLDISEQKQTEEALRESEARFAGILSIAPQAIISTNDDFRITLFNEGAEKTFGYSADEVLGQPLGLLMPEKFRQRHDRLMRDFGDSGDVSRMMGERAEIMALHKDGTEFPAEACISQLNQDGKVTFTALLQDISGRKQRDAQLRQSQKMEAVGQLTGGIAHDFNNLLTAVMGNVELIEAQVGENAGVRRNLEVAKRAIMRGADLTQRLLAFSRKQTLRPVSIEVNGLISSLIDLMTRTLGEDIEIRTALASDVWPARVDESQLENALLNLAINARDAMPDGGTLTIETVNRQIDGRYARNHADIQPGDYVVISVTDTGVGMSEEVLEHAFEPFFTTKSAGKGTGLGLSMIHGFVKQSGGFIWLYSEPGQGTTVTLYLPRADEDMAQPRRIGRDAKIENGHGETVLVVEDDLDVREFVLACLDLLGYRAIAARDGTEALECLQKGQQIDLLLTDVVMPGGVSGIEVAAEFKKRSPGTKILFSSGYAEKAILSHGILDNEAELLPKPYSRKELARKLGEIFDDPSKKA